MSRKSIDIITSFLLLGLAVLTGFYMGKYLKDFVFTDMLWAVLFFVLSMFLLTNLHELGHFLFGKMAGYKLLQYKVGPCCWKYENGSYRFEMEKVKGYMGLCMMIPPAEGVSRKANLLYYAGGILVNIVTGAVCLLIAFLAQAISPLLFLALSIFGLLSIGMGLLNLRPSMSQNNPTDGMILWNVVQGNNFAEGFEAINRMQAELSMGIRPRDMDIHIVENAGALDSYIRVYQHIYLLYKALDKGEKEKVKDEADHIDRMMDLVPSAIEDAVNCELAAVYASLGETQKARSYYDKCREKLTKDKDSNGCRIKAYCAWYLDADARQALVFCEAGLAVADQYPLKGLGMMEEDLIKQLQIRIKTAQ